MPHLQDNHFRPQVDFVDDRFCIFKLEDAGWQKALAERFALTDVPPVLNTSGFSHTWHVPLNDAKLAWVFDYYGMDFARFGYAQEVPEGG